MRIKLIHITCLEQEAFALFVLLHCTACGILVPGHSNESTKSWHLGYLSIPRICYYYSACSVTQPCLTLGNPMDYSPPLSKWESIGLLCPWDSPGKNTGVGCHVLLYLLYWKYIHLHTFQLPKMLKITVKLHNGQQGYQMAFPSIITMSCAVLSRSITSDSLRPYGL